MKNVLITVGLFVFIQLGVSQKIKHGLILNGGIGYLSDVVVDPIQLNDVEYNAKAEFKSAFGLGYKVRYYSSKSFFYDFDLAIGVKKWEFHYIDTYSYGSPTPFYLSLNPTINRKIYRNFFLGAGLAPTVYHLSHFNFDSPVTLKIGYDHKYVGLAMTYSHGLFNSLTMSNSVSKGRMNEISVQLFIPFSGRK